MKYLYVTLGFATLALGVMPPKFDEPIKAETLAEWKKWAVEVEYCDSAMTDHGTCSNQGKMTPVKSNSCTNVEEALDKKISWIEIKGRKDVKQRNRAWGYGYDQCKFYNEKDCKEAEKPKDAPEGWRGFSLYFPGEHNLTRIAEDQAKPDSITAKNLAADDQHSSYKCSFKFTEYTDKQIADFKKAAEETKGVKEEGDETKDATSSTATSASASTTVPKKSVPTDK